MHYASIGWSMGVTLGYAQAAKDKCAIACIGDGSFPVPLFTILKLIITLYILLEFIINI